MIFNTLTLLLILLVCVAPGNGTLRFANYIQDHMVLQRAPHSAVIWGFGQPSTLTTLRINDKVYTTISNTSPTNEFDESIWSITMDPISDEGPFTMEVSQLLSDGTLAKIMLHDILFGDVWICSGQSNMQMTVTDIFNATEEINNAGKYPKIRVFTAALRSSEQPVEELIGIVQNWSVASPGSIGGPSYGYMSAVCWLYGRMIHEALGGRPIGLVATSWGGTVIELWMPRKALDDCGLLSEKTTPLYSYGQSDATRTGGDSSLFNAMIFPFTRMVIYGTIWYQGESNADYNTDKYSCTFSKMIQQWRQIWNERTNHITNAHFPFGFVQLSTFSNTSTIVGGFPLIRWHQTFDIGYVPNHVVPNVFMAVALDLRDDPFDIHPRTKFDVGYRLSRAGLAVAYNVSVEYQGPVVSSVGYYAGSKTVDIIYSVAQDIEVRNTNGFEVCCHGAACEDDSLWEPAIISNKRTLAITLSVPNSCGGRSLYGLRYLWRETPCPFKQAAIYSYTDPNLPAPPYIKLF